MVIAFELVDLFHLMVHPSNIFYTILMVLIILYWLSVIFTGIDFDFDIDIDMDTDVDGVNWLGILGFGKIPIMIIASFVILTMWTANLMIGYYSGNQSLWLVIILFIPLLALGLLIARVICIPLMPLFKGMNQENDGCRFIWFGSQYYQI